LKWWMSGQCTFPERALLNERIGDLASIQN